MVDQARSDQGGIPQQGNDQQPGGIRRNPADNLSRQDRVRGGERSASMQNRDGRGQFAGRKNNKPQEEERERQGIGQGDQNQGGRGAAGGGLGQGGTPNR